MARADVADLPRENSSQHDTTQGDSHLVRRLVATGAAGAVAAVIAYSTAGCESSTCHPVVAAEATPTKTSQDCVQGVPTPTNPCKPQALGTLPAARQEWEAQLAGGRVTLAVPLASSFSSVLRAQQADFRASLLSASYDQTAPSTPSPQSTQRHIGSHASGSIENASTTHSVPLYTADQKLPGYENGKWIYAETLAGETKAQVSDCGTVTTATFTDVILVSQLTPHHEVICPKVISEMVSDIDTGASRRVYLDRVSQGSDAEDGKCSYYGSIPPGDSHTLTVTKGDQVVAQISANFASLMGEKSSNTDVRLVDSEKGWTQTRY